MSPWSAWLLSVPWWHGSACPEESWLAPVAWPTGRATDLARQCIDAWRAGDLEAAEDLLRDAQAEIER